MIKKKLIFATTGLIVLIIGLTLIFFMTDNKVTDIPSHPLLSESNVSAPSPSQSPAEPKNKSPQTPSTKVADTETAPSKLEALKKSEDLDMELVDESLRDYILSLYFEHRNAKDKESFMASITEQLMNDFPPETAKKILKIYEAYIDCELKLQEQLLTYDQPESEEDMLFIANDIYEFRKSHMGEELAEKLFGQEHKLILYKILNKKIYEDESLYGDQKEMQLRLLAAEIFGENADENIYDKTGESLFREKMRIYKKDFEEMNEAEKKAKIREFRQEYLTMEEIEKVEAAEAKIETDNKRDQNYSDRQNAILNDPTLRDDEKQKKVRELQDKVYGDRADEIREGEEFARQHYENMQKALQDAVLPPIP